MADLTATGTSGYEVGSIDSATPLQNGISPRRAEHINGPASAVVQLERILGIATDLKGTAIDLVARLAVFLNPNGTARLSGFTGLVTNQGLLATSTTTVAPANHTPIGMLAPFAGSAAPQHWLLCDGSAVSRTTYSKLLTAIGTTYGAGDGSTTFNVPDMRGRVLIGVDGAANRITSNSTGGGNADTLGGVGGTEIVTLTEAQIPAHTHSYTIPFTGGNNGITGTDADTAGTNSYTSGSTGGSTAHNNTQPWIAINYIIFVGV